MMIDGTGGQPNHAGRKFAHKIRQSKYRALCAQALANKKKKCGLQIEVFGWMTFNTRIGQDTMLLRVPARCGRIATHEWMLVAMWFQAVMESVHTLASGVDKEYGRVFDHIFPVEDTAAHNWLRRRTDAFSLSIIEDYF